ncbi:hypothetical protein ACO02O_11171 [Dirofilaria immitis]
MSRYLRLSTVGTKNVALQECQSFTADCEDRYFLGVLQGSCEKLIILERLNGVLGLELLFSESDYLSTCRSKKEFRGANKNIPKRDQIQN